eukprot:2645457-Amphidinium_carterae.1
MNIAWGDKQAATAMETRYCDSVQVTVPAVVGNITSPRQDHTCVGMPTPTTACSIFQCDSQRKVEQRMAICRLHPTPHVQKLFAWRISPQVVRINCPVHCASLRRSAHNP